MNLTTHFKPMTTNNADRKFSFKTAGTYLGLAMAPVVAVMGIAALNIAHTPSAEAYTTRCNNWGGQVTCRTTRY